MTKMLTPGQAARRIGCSRTSIMRALGNGELRATRDNLGHWSIDPAVLDDWALMRRTPVRHQPDAQVDTPTPMFLDSPAHPMDTSSNAFQAELERIRDERDTARLEAAILKAENRQLRERLVEVQTDGRERLIEAHTDRDRWHALATASRPGFLERVRLLLRPTRVTPN